MSMIVVDTRQVYIPPWVTDFQAFRRWAHSAEFPESGRICYLNGEVWVDLSKEQFTHNQLKGEIASVLMQLAKHDQRGRFFPDGYLLSHPATGLSTNPDGIFVAVESFQTGRVRLVEGAEEGHAELEGTPDMVLEVINQSSVHKDTVELRGLYLQAGIREYWLVDGRGQKLQFRILRSTVRGYVGSRKQAGWLRSVVVGKRFRLMQSADVLGFPEYTLQLR